MADYNLTNVAHVCYLLMLLGATCLCHAAFHLTLCTDYPGLFYGSYGLMQSCCCHTNRDIHTWSTWGMPPQSAIWREQGEHKKRPLAFSTWVLVHSRSSGCTPLPSIILCVSHFNTALPPLISVPLDPERLTSGNGAYFSSDSHLVSVVDHKRPTQVGQLKQIAFSCSTSG